MTEIDKMIVAAETYSARAEKRVEAAAGRLATEQEFANAAREAVKALKRAKSELEFIATDPTTPRGPAAALAAE